MFFFTFSDDSLKEAASTAYAQVCAPYHTWAVRTAVAAGMYALPSRDQLLINLKETRKYKITLVRARHFRFSTSTSNNYVITLILDPRFPEYQ